MSFHNFFFRAIDRVYYGRQNNRKETRFKNVSFDMASDVAYGKGESSILDVCRVSGGGRLPVIFYLHGGGFEAGDKHCRAALARWFATLGYAVMNVNYGLAPEYKFPSQYIQLAEAVNWLKSNASDYGIDLSRAVVGGDSAGAYYAAALCCILADERLQRQLGVNVQFSFGAAVLNCGVYDMFELAHGKMIFSLGAHIFKDMVGVPHTEAENFPYKNLLCIPALVNEKFPASFITYARGDTLCRGQTELLLPALSRCGVKAETFCAEVGEGDHCFSLMWRGRAATENNRRLADFLRRFACS